MSQSQLSDIATQFVHVISPLIAGGALARLGENAADATHALLEQAWKLLQAQFAGDTKAQATLLLYADDAADPKMQQRLAQQIVTRFIQHPEAITGLAAIVQQLQAQQDKTHGAPGRTHRVVVSGNARVGFANAGDFHGSLTVGRMDLGDQGARPAPATFTPAAPTPIATPTLPTTLSTDGVHFSYGHALLIGVGQYASLQSAPATATDAEHLAALLCDTQYAAYPAEQVTVVSGVAATRTGILAALDTLAAKIAQSKHATVLLFFAGHGTAQAGSYYLLPHDSQLGNLSGTALSATTFRQKVDAIAQYAQKLIIILNCCHAGGVTDGVLDGGGDYIDTPPPPAEFYIPLIAGSGRVLISAARPAERAGARSPQDHQLTTFGARLLDGLRGNVPGSGPAVSIFDLFAHLSTHIPADARTIIDPYTQQPLEQHPLLSARHVDQAFAFALRPTADRKERTTLDTARDAVIQWLAETEMALAPYRSEADAPTALIAERDELLARIGM